MNFNRGHYGGQLSLGLNKSEGDLLNFHYLFSDMGLHKSATKWDLKLIKYYPVYIKLFQAALTFRRF